MTIYEAPPHKSRMEMSLGPIAMTTGTDGRVTWEQDGAGNVRILGGEELSEQAADTGFSLENFDPAKNTGGTQVKLRPALDPATHCYVLDVEPKNGSQQTVYLDARTYLVRKTVEHKGGLTSVVSVLAYTLKDGTQVPSHLAIQYAGLPLVIDANLKSVQRLPAVTAAFFAPPPRQKTGGFYSPAHGRRRPSRFPPIATRLFCRSKLTATHFGFSSIAAQGRRLSQKAAQRPPG